MDVKKPNKASHLFLVRLWLEQSESEEEGGRDADMSKESRREDIVEAPAWHGKVQHVLTGRAGSFNSQDSLVQLLASMLPSPKQGRTHDTRD